MMKIGTLFTDLPVEPGYDDAGLPSVRGTFLLPGKFPLLSFEPFLGLSEVLGVRHGRPIREDGEGLKPHVDANLFGRDSLFDRLVLHGEAGVPSVEVPADGTGLNSPLDSPVELELEGPYLGEPETLRGYLKTRLLRVSKGIVTALALEPGIADLALTFLDSAEEVLKRAVNSLKDVLKNLRMNGVKDFNLAFISLQDRSLLAIPKPLPRLFVGVLPVEEGGIVEDAANLKGMFKRPSLLPRRIEAVFIGLSFHAGPA